MLTRLLFRIVPTALAVAFGLITLLAFLLPPAAGLDSLRAILISWASVLAAFALLAGFFNVIGVHLVRITTQRRNWPYSIALLLGVAVTLFAAAFDAVSVRRLDPAGPLTRWLFDNVIVQLEIAVAALIPFFLAHAAYRALRGSAAPGTRRPVWAMLLFLFAALVVLVRTVSFISDETALAVQGLFARLVDSAALGGTRGLLIGLALGTVAAGLRILAAADRPYSE
jgi:hypothetical protein